MSKELDREKTLLVFPSASVVFSTVVAFREYNARIALQEVKMDYI